MLSLIRIILVTPTDSYLKAKEEAIKYHSRSGLPSIELFRDEEVHISLSRPFALRWTQRGLFLTELQRQVKDLEGLDLYALNNFTCRTLIKFRVF
jgi:hypothetical protein